MALSYLDPTLFPYVGGGGYDPLQLVQEQIRAFQGTDPTGQAGYKPADTAGHEFYSSQAGGIPIDYGRYANEAERGWQPFTQSETTIDAANKEALRQWFTQNARAAVREGYQPNFSFIDKLPDPYKGFATDEATKFNDYITQEIGNADPGEGMGIGGMLAGAPFFALANAVQGLGNLNLTGAGLNLASGGLYGTGKALASGDPMQMAAAAASPTSPGGIAQTNTQVRGPASTIGAAAGATLAGGIGAMQGPPVGPEGIPYLTDQSGFAGQQVLIDPATGAAMPGAGLTPDQLTAMAGGGSLASQAGPLAGMAALTALSQFLAPRGGSEQVGGGAGAPGQGTAPLSRPQQPQGGGAQGDTAHIGLARDFENRIKGAQGRPGLSSLADIQRNYPYYMGR